MDGISGTIKKLRDNFFYLQEIFDISEPLKMHIIFYHYEEYLTKTGHSCLGVTDESTEVVHSRFRMFEERH